MIAVYFHSNGMTLRHFEEVHRRPMGQAQRAQVARALQR